MVSLVLRKNRSQPRREEGRGSVDRGGFAGKRTNVCHAAGVRGHTAWPGNSAGAGGGARVELRSRSGDRLWRTLCIPLAKAAAAAKSLQSCPTLCDPIDGSPSGSSVPGILQARILEWVAISFSNACMQAKSLQSCPTLCDPMDSSPPGSSVHGIFLGKNTGVGRHFLLLSLRSLDFILKVGEFAENNCAYWKWQRWVWGSMVGSAELWVSASTWIPGIGLHRQDQLCSHSTRVPLRAVGLVAETDCWK